MIKYLTLLMPMVMEIVMKVEEISTTHDGETKKELALELLDDALDAAAIAKPGILALKPLLMMIAAPLIDRIVGTYNKKGVFVQSVPIPSKPQPVFKEL